jgi:poly-gamma-glutamate synthesis protein (capsule biosynthesis protein)
VVKLFLCGDVMTGRGIDQALPHPGDAQLHEPSIDDASEYVKLAELANGPLPHPIDFSYIWGDASKIFEREEPQAKIINLETAITRSDTHWQSKDVHYKMNPENIACLTVAGIDCCTLANNHTLDWGVSGLLETLEALDNAKIKHAGAGRNLRDALAPAIIEVGQGQRVLVFSLGSTSSGIPAEWMALATQPGLYVIESQPDDPVRFLAKKIGVLKRNGDIVEGIGGYDSFRGDLGLMYFVDTDPASGKLRGLKMIPTQIRRFRLDRASAPDSKWLQDLLNREGKRFNTAVKCSTENTLTLIWN